MHLLINQGHDPFGYMWRRDQSDKSVHDMRVSAAISQLHNLRMPKVSRNIFIRQRLSTVDRGDHILFVHRPSRTKCSFTGEQRFEIRLHV